VSVPPLHVVATDEVAERVGFADLARELQQASGPALALHLRIRTMGGRDLFDLAEPVADRAASTGGWCVVNGRVDVALAAGAQAVQLGRGALPVTEVRRVLCGRSAVGASVHSAAEARRRASEGADYVLAGTVFPTATHPGRAGSGPDLVRACASAGVPVVGIGGIEIGSAASVVEAGAVGIAVVRAVWDTVDPVRSAIDLVDALAAAGREA
jgi:thiamine-phosphate diphosphorylase